MIAKQMQEEYSYFSHYTIIQLNTWWSRGCEPSNTCDKNDEQTINTKCFLLNDVKIRKQHLYFICFKNTDNKYLADVLVQNYLYFLPHNQKNVGFTI